MTFRNNKEWLFEVGAITTFNSCKQNGHNTINCKVMVAYNN